MSFYNYLRRKLQETNISQTQLAKDIKVTNATISRWIKPYSSNPQESSMKKVIEYFGDDCDKVIQVFRAEELWGEYFWKNFRCIEREKKLYSEDVPGVDEKALRLYHSGTCKYIEYEDVKKIAKYYNCSIERLVNRNTVVDYGYENIKIIGSRNTANERWGVDFYFHADYEVGTTEMEPMIHYGDQITLKKDPITNEVLLRAQKGDVVVINCLKHDQYYIRRVDVINEKVVYTACNTAFSPIEDSEDIEVLGIVSQAITHF